ncbi:outer membrane beta-barrel protein [Bergeyella porcorum]|uniref:outer membrane beta-barrel protein n=1 Tax=Bergeyella porcorum TaxID=1735111 RepID=UPI0035E5D56E
MKKVFLLGAFALFGAMNAQESGFEGKTFVTGQVGFGTSGTSGSDASTSEVAIVPAVGHFVSPTIAIGAGIGYESSTNKTNADNKTTVSAFVVKPFARKYWSVADKFYLFGQLDVPMAFGKTKTTVAGKSYEGGKESSFGVFLRPGLDYFLSNNWTIEATIGALGYNSTKPDGGKSANTFGLGLNFSEINFGVKYVF